MNPSSKKKHSSSKKKILEAAQKGNLRTIKFLHRLGVDLSIQDEFGCTALHLAAAKGHIKVIKYLAMAGVDLNSTNYKGATALHYATANGHLKVVEYINNMGGDLYIKDNENNTLLHYLANANSINKKHETLLKFLFKQKLDLNAENNNKLTPLHFAIGNNQFNMSKAFYSLLPNSQNNYRLDYLHTAARYGHLHIAKWLLEQVPEYIHVKDEKGKTPLHWASANGHKDLTQLLLKAGAERFVLDNIGRTPLHYAAKNGHSNVINILLETKILFWFHNKTLLQEQQKYINTKDLYGKTSLDYAEYNGVQQSKESLLSKGAVLSQTQLEDSIITDPKIQDVQCRDNNSTKVDDKYSTLHDSSLCNGIEKVKSHHKAPNSYKETLANKHSATNTHKFTELVTSRNQSRINNAPSISLSKSSSEDSLVKMILQGDSSGIRKYINNTSDKNRNSGYIIR